MNMQQFQPGRHEHSRRNSTERISLQLWPQSGHAAQTPASARNIKAAQLKSCRERFRTLSALCRLTASAIVTKYREQTVDDIYKQFTTTNLNVLLHVLMT